jgi:hypothetical protein
MNFSSAITHKKELGNNEVPVRFAEMSLNLLLVFILLERLAFTFNLGFPKAFLLGIKYVAVFLMIMAAIQKLSNKNNPSLPFVKGLVFVSFLIGLLSFFQKSEPNLADNLQAMTNWFYVGLSIFLSDRFSLRFIRSFIKITTAYSLVSIFFGARAFTTDFRLSFLGLDTRLVGFFGHPNTTALASALFLILSLQLKLEKKWIAFNLILLIITFSNTIFFSLLILILISLGIRHFSTRLVFQTMLVIVSIQSAAPFLITQRIEDQNDLSSLSNRSGVWYWTLSQLERNDFNAIPYTFNRNFESSNIFFVHAHNQVLMDLVKGGFSRAFLVLLFTCLLILVAFFAAKRFNQPYLPVPILIFVLNQATEVPLYLPKIDSKSLILIIALVITLNGGWKNQREVFKNRLNSIN